MQPLITFGLAVGCLTEEQSAVTLYQIRFQQTNKYLVFIFIFGLIFKLAVDFMNSYSWGSAEKNYISSPSTSHKNIMRKPMTSMRASTFIFFLTLLSLITTGQKLISTKDLEIIGVEHGIDSALNIVKPFTEIFQIDTAVALSIALKCDDLKNYSRQFAFFTTTGQVIKNQAINSKVVNNLKTYQNLLSDTVNRQFKAIVIPDQIFHVLVFQNDNSVIPVLKNAFSFWERNADSIRNTYPSKIKRFFQRFKGTPPSEQLFSDCKENCYKIAWTLNKLGVIEFTPERANAIRQQPVPYLRDYDMERFRYKADTFGADIIQLTQSYNSIAEIDFDNEPEFVKLKENLEGEKCYGHTITNNKMALYDIGCSWRRGKTLKLELLSGNTLRVTVINSWIS